MRTCIAFQMVVLCSVASAVSPTLTSMHPPGAQRGHEVEIEFRGSNLQDAVGVLFHEEGIEFVEFTSTEGGATKALLRISPEAALGTHGLRVRTATGLSNLRLFSVGNLSEVNEAEPNNNNDEAQVTPLGTTVNGVVAYEDVDYYSVTLEKGDHLAVEAEAIRLGTILFDIKLRLFGPGGHELIAEDDTALLRQDAGFVYTAEEAGVHRVAVSEASYGGNVRYQYRLHIGQFPRPFSVTPLGGKSGTEVAVTWLGDPSIASQTVALQAELRGTDSLSPRSESGLSPTGVPFRVSPFDGVLETEPNNSRETASLGVAPGAFDGVIQSEDDTDWFSFEGKKGAQYDFRLWARELGSPLDSVMTLVAPSGKQVGTDDDARGMDSYFRATLPEDGVYGIWVADHLRRGGATFAYRVEATPIAPSLAFRVEENDSLALVVPRGNQTFMLMTAMRTGFDADLPVRFEGLPEGVSVSHPPLVKGQTKLPVILTVTPEAALSGALVDIAAAHEAIEGGIKQSVSLVEGNNRVVFEDREVTRLALAVTEPAPYSIHIKETHVPVIRGTNKALRIVATRAEGFTSVIKLRVPYVPSGYGAGTAVIASDQTEVNLILEAKGNSKVGSVPVVVIGESDGYQVCTPSMSIDVADRWVSFAPPSVDIEQGQETEVTIPVTHSTPYEGTFKATLVMLPKGVSSEPQEFSHDTTELTFPLRIAADAPPGKHNSLVVQSYLTKDDEPIRHLSPPAKLQIFKPLPPELQKPPPPPVTEKQPKKKAPPKKRTRFPETS